MQIHSNTKGARPVTELTAGMVFTETVQLTQDLTPVQHSFAVVSADIQPDGSVAVAAVVDRTDQLVSLGFSADEQVRVVRAPFKPGYPVAEARIYRKGLRVSREDGTATVTFRGQVANALLCFVERTSHGLSLFAEVVPDETSATAITVAVVPTGKRVPDIGNSAGVRLGSVGGSHVYLLAVDGSVDRGLFEATEAARAAQRALGRGGFSVEEGDDDSGC